MCIPAELQDMTSPTAIMRERDRLGQAYITWAQSVQEKDIKFVALPHF